MRGAPLAPPVAAPAAATPAASAEPGGLAVVVPRAVPGLVLAGGTLAVLVVGHLQARFPGSPLPGAQPDTMAAGLQIMPGFIGFVVFPLSATRIGFPSLMSLHSVLPAVLIQPGVRRTHSFQLPHLCQRRHVR